MNYIGSKKTLKDWIFQIINKYTKEQKKETIQLYQMIYSIIHIFFLSII